MEKILEKAFKYPENLLDAGHCWKCGDAIIAIECPDQAELFTSNIKHYQPLLSSLSRALLTADRTIEGTKEEVPAETAKKVE